MCSLAHLLIQKRLPDNKVAGSSIDLKALTEVKYTLTTLAVLLVELAVFIPYTYITSYGVYVGLSSQHALELVTLLNVGAVPGRALPGYFADRLGPFNVMIYTSLVCALSIFCLWLTASDNVARITAFSVIFGFWSGAAISLTPICVGQVCETKDYGKRSGTTNSIASFGALLGIPIAATLLRRGDGSYENVIIFSGIAYLLACIVFSITRTLVKGAKWDVIF